MHFIYYRESGNENVSAMTAAILVRTSKRRFPSYIVCRSIDFWPDRKHLLDYYEAVNIFKQFTTTLEDLYAGRKDGRAQSEERWKEKEAATLAEAWSLCESVLSKWQEIISQKSMASQVEDWDEPRLYFRKRFESGNDLLVQNMP